MIPATDGGTHRRSLWTIHTATDQGRQAAVTWRVAAVCAVLIPFNLYWITQSECVRWAAFPTTASLFYNVVVSLLVLLGINRLLYLLRPHWALSPAELACVYVLLSIASAAGGLDFGQVLVPAIAYPYHFATPENGWAQLFHADLPAWLLVQGPSARAMWEGGHSLLEPPMYRPWLGPTAWWTAFAAALFLTELGINSLFRRRWVNTERLTFPIIRLPLELVSPETELWRNRGFYVGVALAVGVELLNGLNALYPAVPALHTRLLATPSHSLMRFLTGRPWNAMGYVGVAFYPFAIGLGMLLPLELSFSCWFFLWMFKLERVAAAWLGVTTAGSPWVLEQSFGGFLGLALFALWIGRGYLGETFRRALGPREDDPGGEWRRGYLMLGVGLAFLLLFSLRMGASLGYSVAFFVIYLLLSLAVTRIRAEMGLMAHDLHYSGPHQSLERILGSRALGKANSIVGATYYWFNRAYRSHAMPHAAEGMKLVGTAGGTLRGLTGAMVTAMVVGTLLSFVMQLAAYFDVGAAAGTWPPHAPLVKAWEPWIELGARLSAPTAFRLPALLATLAGVAVTFGGMMMRTRLFWWPLHPVGYAVSSSWAMERLWCPLLIAWAAKALLARYGGRAYLRVVPFALGLVLGDFVIGSFWNLYGVLADVRAYSFWD